METRQSQFREPIVHDQFNQSMMEKSSRPLPQAPLPEILPSGVSVHNPGSQSSFWLSELPHIDTKFFDENASPNSPRFSTENFPIDANHSISPISSVFPIDPFQYTTPSITTKSDLRHETFGVPSRSFDLCEGGISLAATSYDYDLIENGFDSETRQKFSSESNLTASQRNRAAAVLPWMNPRSKLSRANPEEWGKHRAVVTKMYSEEQKTLKEIMDFMEKEYGFRPS